MSDAANRKASHKRLAANRRDSVELASNVKLKSTTTTKMKTTVVVSNSRDRNSVRSSLPSNTAVFENKLTHAPAKVKIEGRLAPVRVSAITDPASNRSARVASAEISDSPWRLIKIVQPASLIPRKVSASHVMPYGSSPVAGSSNRKTEGSFSSARAMAIRWRI